jgi:Flp pilus assembly protein TadD
MAYKSFFSILSCSAVMLLSACNTTSSVGYNTTTGLGGSVSVDGGLSLLDVESYDPFTRSMLTSAQQAQGQRAHTDMAVFLRKAYGRNPEDVVLARHYARALRLSGDAEKSYAVMQPLMAKAALSKTQNTEHSALRYEMASALLDMGRGAEALTQTQILANNNPESAQSHGLLALAQDINGLRSDADASFQKALSLSEPSSDGVFPMIANNYALFLASNGRGGEAVSMMDKAMVGAQKFPQIRQNALALESLQQEQGIAVIEPAAGEGRMQPIMDDRDLMIVKPVVKPVL